MFGNRASDVIREFFAGGGCHPQGGLASRFYLDAFRRPSDLGTLLEAIKSDASRRKIVIVDGHARSGKSWVSLAAFALSIEKERLSREQWWTTGVDSLAVCQRSGNSLNESATTILNELRTRKDLRLVLIDDFLGTTSLRRLSNSNDVSGLRSLLSWNDGPDASPLLASVPEGCTILISERSVFLTIIEMVLGLDLRGIQGLTSPSTLLRHGLFRKWLSREPTGAYTAAELEEVCASNETYHPFVGRGRDWLLGAAPVLAFGRHYSTPRDKATAALSLFGDDIDQISRTVREFQNGRYSWLDNEDRMEETQKFLEEAYLIAVAPALLFWAPQAYEQFGIPKRRIESIRSMMYLSAVADEKPADLSSPAGRIPNEFYMRAVQDHLRHNLAVTAHSFRNVVVRNESHDGRAIGQGLRGLLEIALATGDPQDVETLRSHVSWKEIFDHAIRGGGEDLILYLESDGELRDKSQDITPGLSAYITWALYRFFYKKKDVARRRAVAEWFRDRLGEMIRTAQAPSSAAAAVDSAGRESDWSRIFGAFSPALQWAIRLERERGVSDFFDEIEMIFLSLPYYAQGQLRMILEDEVVWATVYLGREAPRTRKRRKKEIGRDGTQFQSLRSREIAKFNSFVCRDDFDDFLEIDNRELTVNRVFSLVWHNEWMEHRPGNQAEENATSFAASARMWLERSWSTALGYLKEDGGLIDDNLQYHWVHFITQHSVWMRDWCFEPDPAKFEQRRVAPGSKRRGDNARLVTLALQIVTDASLTQTRLRNLIFLLGTRAHKLPRLKSCIGSLKDRINSSGEELSAGFAQAVFELSRQGYFDLLHRKPGYDQWSNWCRQMLSCLSPPLLSVAWDLYRTQLEQVSHRLDPIPPKEGGWEQIRPLTWMSPRKE